MNNFSYNQDKAPHRDAEPPVLDVPHAARVYDYFIGGENNWAIDRDFAEQQIQRFPVVRNLAWHNRLWMNRVVRSALDAGITQFLDLGAGLPNETSPHVIADQHDPDAGARVVYVDNEPVVGSHTQLMIENGGLESRVGITALDLRKPAPIMRDATVDRLINLDKPVCVLMVACLHFVSSLDKPARMLSFYREHLASGSWVAISHLAGDLATREQRKPLAEFRKAYEHSANRLWVRNRNEIGAWFDGFDLVEPGLVSLDEWRPDREWDQEIIDQVRPYAWCGVGQKP